MSASPKSSASLATRAFAYVRLMHAGPVAAVMLASLLFAIVAYRGWPSFDVLLPVLTVVFCSQYAIGALNDYCDRELDAAAGRAKPIVQGLVPAWVALSLASIAFTLMAVLALAYGPILFVLAVAAGTSGLLYDLGLKFTPFSWLPYFVSFPSLPIWVRSATLGVFEPRILWLIPILGSAVIALHLGNNLPDLELDTVQGSRNLAVTLGLRGSLLASWGSLLMAQAIGLFVSLTPIYETTRPLLWLAEGVSLVLLLVAIFTYRVAPSRRGRTAMFYVLGGSAISLVLGWLVAI